MSFSMNFIQHNLYKMLVSKPEGAKSLGRTEHSLDHMYESGSYINRLWKEFDFLQVGSIGELL